MESLARKYRPKAFQDIVGNRQHAVVLNRMVESGRVPFGLLFSGPSGVGKTTAARILSAALHSEGNLELDAASNGGVDEIRKLLDIVRYSTGSEHRVLILDEAHSITKQGFEALLKTLEEPPAGVYFVLCSTEPHKIPPTILGRLIEFQFRSVSAEAILDRLVQIVAAEGLVVDLDLLRHLAQQSNGDVRSAIQSLDKAIRAETLLLRGYLEMVGDEDPAPSLMVSLMNGNHAQIFEILESMLSTIASPAEVTASLVSCIRDLFILKSGGTLSFSGPALAMREDLARRLEIERLFLAVRMLWDVKTKIRIADDPRGSLELALILVSEAFTRGKQVQAVTVQKTPEVPPARKLSLAEMRTRGSS